MNKKCYIQLTHNTAKQHEDKTTTNPTTNRNPTTDTKHCNQIQNNAKPPQNMVSAAIQNKN